MQCSEPFVPNHPVTLFPAWCLRNEGVSSVLLGSSNPEQLIENLGAIQASARGGRVAAPACLLRYFKATLAYLETSALVFLRVLLLCILFQASYDAIYTH